MVYIRHPTIRLEINILKLLTCVMFKDEEEVLRRCLESVKDITDEFILMDTGSTDKSITIASSYGEVNKCEFEDFVITKNKVLDIAYSKNPDMVLWMDADEFIDKENENKLKAAIKDLMKSKSNILLTDIVDRHDGKKTTNRYIRPRVWKTIDKPIFKGPGIHEFIPYKDSRDIIRKDIRVIHQHKKKGKDIMKNMEFYVDILKRYEEKDPDDIRCLFYMARSLMEAGRYKEAHEYFHKYRETSERINYIYMEEYWFTYYDQSNMYTSTGDYSMAMDMIHKCIELLPERADAYAKGIDIAYYKLKDLDMALEIGESGRHLKNFNNSIMFTDPFAYPYRILDTLSLVYWDMGEYSKGLECINDLLSLEMINEYHYDRIKSNQSHFQRLSGVGKKNIDINRYFDNIFCINLAKRKDRKDLLQPKLKKLGISVEWFRGYDGSLLSQFVDENVPVLRTPGYIGCLLSHLEVMKIALDRGYDKILILEDDIAIHKNIRTEFDIVINQMESDSVDWDILYIGHASFSEPYTLGFDDGNWTSINNHSYNRKYTKTINSWACHGYALNRKAMEEILDYYDKNGYVYELDRVLAGVYQGSDKLKIYSTYPQLVVQNDTTSDNDPTGISANHFERFLNRAYSSKENYI